MKNNSIDSDPIFYCVVIIYNSFASCSVTVERFQSFSIENAQLIVVDNSTDEIYKESNRLFSIKNENHYIDMNGNAGLSKAYNTTINYLESFAKASDVIVWLDDDTEITDEYFELLRNAVKDSFTGATIFTPIIQGQNGHYYSPNEFRLLKNRQIKSPTESIKQDRFNAINSCTAVKLSVYSNWRYDEQLFLDQVDHYFFEAMRNRGEKFEIIRTTIQHDFSLKDKSVELSSRKNRYRIMVPDYLYFCSKSNARLLIGMMKVFLWGVRESLIYKNAGMLPWMIRLEIDAASKLSRRRT